MSTIFKSIHIISRALPARRKLLNENIHYNLSKKVVHSQSFSHIFRNHNTPYDDHNRPIHNKLYTNCINSNIHYLKIKNNSKNTIAILVFCSSIVYLLKNIFDVDADIIPIVQAKDLPSKKSSNRSTANFIADAIQDVLPGVVHIGSMSTSNGR